MAETLNEAAERVDQQLGRLPFGASLQAIRVFSELYKLGGFSPTGCADLAIQAAEEMKNRTVEDESKK